MKYEMRNMKYDFQNISKQYSKIKKWICLNYFEYIFQIIFKIIPSLKKI